jgi:ABC-2 type transport system ATP-binding protein
MSDHNLAVLPARHDRHPPDGGRFALEARDLVKTYPAGRGRERVRALDGLTIRVPRGRVFGLLGPNGAGKSTTVKIVTTLSSPDSGDAIVAGISVRRDPQAVRRQIGLVSQGASSDQIATGRENLLLAARIQGLGRHEARTRAGELLDRFDLTADADRLVRTYSGGMSRKLDVAIGLVHRPRVLFLDEPTTGLDPEARAQMWAEIAQLTEGEQITVLLTTHYLDEADRLADQLAIIDAGRVVAEGTPDQLKQQLRGDTVLVELADAGHGAPAAAALDRVSGVREVAVTGTSLRARADNGGSAVPAVLAALETVGSTPVSVTVARPSLDDVYLQYAGRTFQGAQEVSR